jgi:uncharacterized protein (DUF2235 family)
VPKNVVICLDGTNNKVRAAANTNVVRLFEMLELKDPTRQVAYYDPGVGTFSSQAAWSPPARTASRYAGLLFGAGLRHNLGEAYEWLMSVYEEGDRVYVFGFSRGAYNARALCGLLEVCGLLRRGEQNLVPYLVGEYARQDKRSDGDASSAKFAVLRQYHRIFSRSLPVPGRPGERRRDRFPVHFVGVWDTVKAAGHLWRTLTWPYTVELPHAATVRHAVSIDERRRPYREYLLRRPTPQFGHPVRQDLQQVWFAGVHSDVGGMFTEGARLSDVPLKWMAEQAVAAGLLVKPRAYNEASVVGDENATGPIHRMSPFWHLLGRRRRRVPEGAAIHASVQRRIAVDPSYAQRLPASHTFVDPDWAEPKPLKPKRSRARRTIDLETSIAP